MSSKRLFSWSRRQSGAEPYYRTGGLLPIDLIDIDASGSDSSNTLEPKVRVHSVWWMPMCWQSPYTWLRPTGATPQRPEACAGNMQPAFCLTACIHLLTCFQDLPDSNRRRPTHLTIIPPDSDQFVQNPLSSPRTAALASSSSNLFAIFNDMLRSPTLNTTVGPRSASIHKPLPTRPRSLSLPSDPDPVELPGSILQDNQGYPNNPAVVQSTSSRPVSQHIRRETHPPDRHVEDDDDDDDPACLLELVPRPLNHAKSVPSLVSQYSTMRPARNSRRAPVSSTATTSNPIRMQHRVSLNDLNQRGMGKMLQPSPMVNEGKSRASVVSERTSRRDDVSVAICFSTLRCLLVEYLLHEETVSDHFFPHLFSPCGTLSA
jgi:hypothetical protein